MNKEVKYWLIQITFWLIYTAFGFISFVFAYGYEWFLQAVVFFVLSLFGTHFYRLILKRSRISYSSLFSIFVCSLIGISLLGGIQTGIMIYFDEYLFGAVEAVPNPIIDFTSLLTINDIYVFPWFACYHIYKYAESLNKIALEKSKIESAMVQAEALLKTAELANLKNQLNPHFLFNALNGIKALTLTHPHSARDAITQLSDLLRASLNLGNQKWVTVDEEIALVKDYLALEKLRFEERLSYRLEIAEETLHTQILPMILQTLVENAVKHGIARRDAGGHLDILSLIDNNELVLRVTNGGNLTVPPDTGIGLRNLEKRLELNYGKNASLKVFSNQNTVKAEIRIPLYERKNQSIHSG